ncbi:MAG: hypothetical protein SGJ27_10050 [Candidatus Melainabacteria bacterium]|nr:hypothetical protein [Candidatus Melainabacteria bacterium]
MNNWPTPQEFNEAIQTPQLCFSDADLKNTRILLNPLGLPKSATGAFASVYKATNGSTSWAVRCFLSNRPEMSARYQHISDFVLFDNLDSTVDFHYLAEGVRVKGHWYPCLKMVWVEGPTLDQYVEVNYKNSEKMTALLKSFHQMVGELEGAGIGHGDLQHGNIIVTDQGLRLVDYDALFVPALKGLKSLEFGHPNYQHPQRTENDYDTEVDHFSCWLIHTSLLSLAIDPSLYRSLGGGDESLIFKRKDLTDPENSAVFAALLAHDSDHIKEAAHLLRRMLWAAPNTIPYLGAPLEVLDKLPQERLLKAAVGAASQSRTDGAANDATGEIAASSNGDGDGDGVGGVGVGGVGVGEAESGSGGNGRTSGHTSGHKSAASKPANAEELHSIWGDDADDDGVKRSQASLHFASGYDAIAASSLERKTMTRKPATKLRQLTQGTFRAGVQARDRIKKMAEKLEQSTLPANWSNRKYTEATELFDKGEYEKAAKVFLDVFKQLDENRNGKSYFDVAIFLGSSFSLCGNPGIAGNYFVVAYNYAKRQDRELQLPRAGLALALSKYEEQETTAWKFLDDNPRAVASLSEVIYDQMSNPYFARTVTYKMLRDYAVRMVNNQHFHGDSFSDAFSDAVDSAWIVLQNIMREDPNFNDESLIESFILLAGRLLLVNKAARAKEMLFRLAENCDSYGFPELAKTAKFCGATVLNSVPNLQYDALEILSSLGHMSTAELTKVATAAGAFIEHRAVLQLLLTISKTFEQMGNPAEAKDALKVACRVCANSDAAFVESIVAALDVFHTQTISDCLNESYLSPICDPEILSAFISFVSDSSYSRVQSVLLDYYIATNDVTPLADLLSILATRADTRSFAEILSTERSIAPIVNEAADMTIENLCTTITGGKSPVPPGDFASFPWHKYTASLNALDNFRVLFKLTKNHRRSDQLLALFADNCYSEIVEQWFLQLVAANNYDRYYNLAHDLATASYAGALERLISQLVRHEHLSVVDYITKNLTLKGHLVLLIEISESLASKGNLAAFAQLSKEIANSAQLDELITTIDNLIETDHEGTDFVVTLLKRMLQHKQVNKAARILQHLYKIEKLSLASGLSSTLMSTGFHQSLFEELLKQEDFSTTGALLACLAPEIKNEGMLHFLGIMKEGGVSDSNFAQIIINALDELMARMVKLLPDAEHVATLAGTMDAAQKQQLERLNSTMMALHYLRYFVSTKNDVFLLHVAQSLKIKCIESFNSTYDPLVAAWCLHAAREKQQKHLNAVTLQLATNRINSALDLVVDQLLHNNLVDALYGISSYMVNNGYPENALRIALRLGKDYIFEAKTITTQIIKYTNAETSLENLIAQCVEVNDKLADMIVRQLASSDRSTTLKGIANTLALSGNAKALSLVLTQLASTDENFQQFVSLLAEKLPEDRIDVLGEWLVEMGMTTVIRRRVTALKRDGKTGLVDLWGKFLPESER